MRRIPWEPAEVAQLAAQYPHMKTKVIAAMLGRSLTTVYQRAQILGLGKTPEYFASPAAGRTNGRQGIGSRFVKGQVSWNKGTHYTAGGRSAETRFPKGHMPHNWKPVGTTRINSEGYMDIKVTDMRRGALDWVAIHRLNWIAVHGPIPKGYMLRFKDRNPRNTLVENLELVTRADHMRQNSYHRYPQPIPRLIQLRGALTRQINKREGKRA